MVKIVTTKAQKQLESFKTEKPPNNILLKFSAKQSVDFRNNWLNVIWQHSKITKCQNNLLIRNFNLLKFHFRLEKPSFQNVKDLIELGST